MDKHIAPLSKVSLRTLVTVTGSLALLGGGAGAAVAVAVVVGLGVGLESLRLTWQAVAGSAGLGALCGATFGPLLAWTLLRQAPIGRAVLETAAGAAIGAAVAIALPVSGVAGLLGMAAVGALAAAVRLRLAMRRRSRSP